MRHDSKYFLHSVCLGAMFVLGGSVIIEPIKGANELTLLAFMVATAVSVGAAVLISPLFVKLFSSEGIAQKGAIRTALYILYICIGISALAVAVKSSSVFTDFVCEVILPRSSRFAVALVLFAVALLPSIAERGSIMKFSLLSAVISAAAIIMFFAFSMGELRMENIKLLSLPRIDRLGVQVGKVLLRVFLPAAIYYIYVGMNIAQGKRAACAFGTLGGGALLALAISNVMLLFGPQFAGKLDFPYASAVGSVTVGELFTRLDGFSYIIYLVSTVIRISVCVAVIREILKRLGEKHEKYAAAFCLLAAVLIGVVV